MIAADLVSLLRGHRFDLSSEDQLQRGIEHLLRASTFQWEREVIVTPRDRIDFLVEGCGVECKIDGTGPGVIRQLHRYAQQDAIRELLLVTTKSRHLADVLGVKAEQARGIRDPNAPLVQAMGHDGQHAKRLAEAYLAKTKGQPTFGHLTNKTTRRVAQRREHERDIKRWRLRLHGDDPVRPAGLGTSVRRDGRWAALPARLLV